MSSSRQLLSWHHSGSPRRETGSQCNWNRTPAPCIRPGKGTMLPGRISWRRHYSMLPRLSPQFGMESRETGRIPPMLRSSHQRLSTSRPV